MKKLILILISVTFIFCGKKEKLKDERSVIYGDWFIYSLDFPRDSNPQDSFDYTELYFSNNKMYRYSNLGGGLSPINYEISKDSLFYNAEDNPINNKKFIGKLNSKKKDTLYIVNMNDTLVLYRLYSESKLMSNYIDANNNGFEKFDKSNEVFLKDFLDRMQQLFKIVK